MAKMVSKVENTYFQRERERKGNVVQRGLDSVICKRMREFFIFFVKVVNNILDCRKSYGVYTGYISVLRNKM